jgi:hypothetical protein
MVSDAYYRDHAGFVVSPIDHPVGTSAGTEPVVHRREKPLADPVGGGEQWAGADL